MLVCQVLGHHLRFHADGVWLRWHCDRCGRSLGGRRYARAELAERYAGALERQPRVPSGRGAPPFALFPFRLASRTRR
jgi:hypothetical protein